MKQNNIRIVDISVSPDNFINWELLRAVKKIKPTEEVLEVYDVKVHQGMIDFKVKLRKDN